MKIKFISTTMVLLMATVILTRCGEASKKNVKSANKNIEMAEEDLKQSENDSPEEVRTIVKSKWEEFRSESESVIKNNEGHIKELREKITKSGQKERDILTNELDLLELKNKELKEKLAERERKLKEDLIEFDETKKEKQHKFEKEFKHDLQILKEALLKIVTPPGNVENEF